MTASDLAAALSSERRLLILRWLKAPRRHFPRQVHGDLVEDGVCGLFIANKLGITQASASLHLSVLTDLGLLRARRIKQWTFYRRDDARIARARRVLDDAL